MNYCDTCPHMAKIKAALVPCHKCEAGRLHHQRQFDDADERREAVRAWNRKSVVPAAGVTTISPDAEDAMREFIASLFALSPIKLLLARHIMRGGDMTSFADTLNALNVELAKRSKSINGHGFHSVVRNWAQDVIADIPQLKSPFAAVIAANNGRRLRSRGECETMI